jgi:hypothetical protein
MAINAWHSRRLKYERRWGPAMLTTGGMWPKPVSQYRRVWSGARKYRAANGKRHWCHDSPFLAFRHGCMQAASDPPRLRGVR